VAGKRNHLEAGDGLARAQPAGDGMLVLPPAREQAIDDVVPLLLVRGLRGLSLEGGGVLLGGPDRCARLLGQLVHRPRMVAVRVGDEDRLQLAGQLPRDAAPCVARRGIDDHPAIARADHVDVERRGRKAAEEVEIRRDLLHTVTLPETD
jgi:hypothetical protein